MQQLTRDKISGIVAPKGQIMGFHHSHIRANWPNMMRGKLLDDKRIAYYQAKGYYGSNGVLALAKKQTAVKVKHEHETAQAKYERLVRKYK